MPDFVRIISDWFLKTGVYILVIIVVTFVLLYLIRKLSRYLEKKWIGEAEVDPQHHKRLRTLVRIIKSALILIVALISCSILLEILGIDMTAFLAGAGVIGIVIGLGAQSFIQDIISGTFAMLQGSYNVGDVVEIAGKKGVVESISLRITKLRDLSGNVHFIPNGEVRVITNMTSDYSRVVIDIGVAYKEDTDNVIEVLKEIDEEFRTQEYYDEMILSPLEILGLESFDESQVTIRTRYKTKPLKQWEVARAFRKDVKKKFDTLGIEIPFPHLTLYIGKDNASQGSLRVNKSDDNINDME